MKTILTLLGMFLYVAAYTQVPAQPVFSSAPDPVCEASTQTYSVIPDPDPLVTYTWTIPAGWTITSATSDGPSIDVLVGNTGGNIDVFATNSNGNSTTASVTITVNSIPSQPGTITGGAAVCDNTSGHAYSIAAVSGATGYTWSYSGTGVTINNNGTTNVTLDFAAGATSGTLSVTADNSCGSSTAQGVAITVSAIPAQPGAITGGNAVCDNTSGHAYSIAAVSGATGYTWSYSGTGVTINNNGTTNITLDFAAGATAGTLSVTADNGCGSSTAQSIAITVSAIPAQPGVITGGNAVCDNTSGHAYSIAAVSGATGYTWSYSGTGVTINNNGTTNITLDFAAGATSGTLSVTADNGCGSSTAQSIAITVSAIPAQPGVITGGNAVCDNTSGHAYSIAAVSGATGYTWSYSGTGVTINNNGTANITLDFAAGATNGTLSVTADNGCGNSTAQTIAITVSTIPVQPGVITGGAAVCDNTSGHAYSIAAVSGATGYTWSYSGTGVTINNNGTTNVTLDFAAGATGGTLSVTADNGCGSSIASTTAISINVPASITTQPSDATICPTNNTSFTVLAAGTTLTYQWQVSTDAGATWNNATGGVYTNGTTATLNLTNVPVTMNTYQYRVVVTGACGPVTSSAGILTVNTATSITTQPTNVTICPTNNTSFTVVAAGTTLTYQWQVSTNGGFTYGNVVDGGVYSGATTATLNLTNVPVTMTTYRYRVVVTGACGAVTSTAGILTVNTATSITTQPSNVTICPTNNTSFTVLAAGTTLTYQWQVSTDAGATWNNATGGVYTNGTTATLNLTNVPVTMNTYQYRVVVTGACGPVTSSAGILTVNTATSITTQPTNVTICPTNNTSFTVVAAGTTLTYQWQVSTNGGFTYGNVVDGGVYSGATTATLNLTNVPVTMTTYRYRVVVTGACGAVTSTAGILTVNTATSITTQPSNVTICPTNNTSFTVLAAGTTLTYQWQVSTDAGATWNNATGGVYTNGTTATLNLTNVPVTMNTYQYRVVVTGACGPVTSSAGILTVNTATSITTQPTNVTICPTNNTSFTVVAAGTTLTYQWQVSTNGGFTYGNVVDGGVYAGATTATLNLTNVPVTMTTYRYRVVVTGACGAVTSTAGILTVNTATSITTQPSNVTICPTNNTSFTVLAAGTTLTYQWQVSTDAGATWNNATGGVYTNGTTATLNLTNVPVTMNTYQYRVVVTGACGPVTSSAGILTVNTATSITTQPTNVTICPTNNTSFTVVAAGTTLTYQWQVSTNGGATWNNVANGGVYAGATAVTLTLTNVPVTMNTYQYRVVVTGTCGAATSSAGILAVNTATSITTQPGNATICPTNNTSFTVLAAGTTLTYQWQESTNGGGTWNNVANGGVYGGATTATLALTGVPVTMNSYQYRVVVTGACGPVTSSAGILTVNTATSITTQPANVTICPTNNTSFTVVATGTGVLTYQWQVSTNGGGTWNNVANGGVYAGATAATLTLTNVPVTMNTYQYRVVITGTCGAVTSGVAILTVNAATAITTQPSNTTACPTTNASFTVVAAGTGVLTYQWQVSTNGGGTWNNVANGGVYGGATTATLALTGVPVTMNTYQYRVIVTGTCNAVTSTAATLTVNATSVINTQPSNATICPTNNTSFVVAASGTAITYQWQLSTDGGGTWNNVTNGGVYSGATAATLNLTNVPVTMNSYQYRANASGSCGAVTSNPATLTVNVATVITTQPTASSICATNNTSFTVAATGAGVLTYQWQVSTNGGGTWNNVANGGVYSGATTATLALTGVPVTMNTYQYRVIVTGTCGAVTSTAVLLTVSAVTTITTQPSNSTICASSNTSFAVTATGAGVVTYQWQVSTNGGGTWNNVANGGVYAGATAATLTLTNVPVTMTTYQYRVIVNSTCGSVTSTAVTLTVNAVPTAPGAISGSTTICAGTPSNYSVGAVATATSYTWNYSGTGISITNGTTNNPTITFTGTATSGNLTVVPVNGCGSGPSSVALAITVNPQPQTIATNSIQSICSGDFITPMVLSSSNSVAGALYGYSWANPGGITSTIPSASFGNSLADGYTISGSFTNSTASPATVTFTFNSTSPAGCAGTTATATITVSAPTFAITQQPADAPICEGSDATFTVAATTGITYTYQWYVSTDNGTTWNAINAATLPIGVYTNYTTATLYLNGPTTAMNGYQYSCRVQAPCGAATTNQSPGAILSIGSIPSLTITPPVGDNCGAAGVTLTASGAGVGGTYTWSPATGLSTTTGATVIANPVTPPIGSIVYTVTGTSSSSAGCSSTGTVTVNTALSGTYNIGGSSGIPFANTLTEGIQKAVALGLCGPTTFLLRDVSYSALETFPISINAIPGASAVNTLTIKPGPGVSPVISGSVANNALMNILSSYIIIDGSNTTGGTTRNLTITNTNTTFPTVLEIGSTGTQPITNTIVKNSIIIDGTNDGNTAFDYDATYGSRGATGIMVIAGGSTRNPDGGYFNNITIQNNDIRRATSGIWARAADASGTGSGLNITGNIINAAGAANCVSMYGVYTRDVFGVTVQNNDIGNMTNSYNRGSYPYMAGVWFAEGTTNTVVTLNTIHDLTFSVANGAPSGVYITPVTNGTDFLSENIIRNLTSGGNANTAGIFIPNFPSAGIILRKNYISNIKNTNAGGTAMGMWLENNSTSATTKIENNMIWDLAAPGNSYGIYLNGSGTFNVHFNSINVNNPSGGTAGGTSAALYVAASSANSLDVQNNIFANTLTTSTRYAIYSAVGNNAYSNIDFNDYFTAAGGTLGFLGGARANMANWQTATGQDGNSLNVNPQFQSTTDLHLNYATTTLGGAGTAIAGIPDDIDGATRPATPACGADEDNTPPTCFRPTDLNATGIVYNGATISWTAPVSGSPAIYNWEIHTGPGIGSPLALSGNTTAPTTSAAVTGLTENTAYYLFVRTNCGGANNSIWSGPYAFLTPIQPLCGTYHVGIAQAAPFNRLTNAINRLNLAGISCPVIFLLDDATYGAGETFPITINAINGGSSVNTFTLKPNTGQSPVITGSVNNNGILTLSASKYVTIDGSNGSATGSKNLTVINTNTGTGAMTIQFTNDASYDTLKNTIVQGVTTGTIGVVTFNGATSTGNSYNTVYNNDITKAAGANYPTNAIHNQGTAGIVNTGNTISGNRLFDFSQAGFVDEAYSSGTVFSGNEIYVNTATNGAKYGIWLQNASITSMSISANNIHDLNTANASGVYGISIQDAGSCTIINNYINLYATNANATPLEGIWDQLGAGKTSNIYFNTIAVGGAVAGTKNSDAFLKSSTGTTNLKDNILYNTRTSAAGKHYAIRYNTTAGLISNVNDIYNIGGATNVFGNNGIGAGTDRVSLATWQGATAQDANSVNILPVFAALPTDLHMSTGSNLTLDNQGTPIAGITKDFDFDTRSASTPDIGADEFGANVPTLRYWAGTDFWNTSNINWGVQTGGPYAIAPWVIDYTANLEKMNGTITTSAAVRAEAINVGTTPTGSNLTYNIIPGAAANTLTLTNTATINVATGSTLNIAALVGPAILNGTSGLIKKGGGLLALNYQTGATFSGLIQVSDGIMQLKATAVNTLPVTSNVDILSTGTLQVSRSQTLNNLNLYSGNLVVDAGQVLTINGTFTIVSGTISAASGGIVYGPSGKLIYAGYAVQNTGNEAVAAAAVKNIVFNNGSWEGVQVNNNIAVATTDTVSGWVDMTGNGSGSYALTGAATSRVNGLTSVNGDGSFNSGSNTIQMTSATGIKLGMKITGTGIATNTYVIYISGNVLTISANTTASSPGGGTGTTPLVLSFRGGLIINHAAGVGQAIAVAGTKQYSSGARYKFTTPAAGVIYPALPAGVDSAWDVTMATGIGNRVVLGTASPLTVTDSLNLYTGVLVTGNNLLTWSNLPGGALIAPEPTWTQNSTNYTKSFIATSDVAGVPLNVADATTAFAGNAGFRIKNVTNADTYFPVGPSFLPSGTNFTLPTPNRMMLNNQSGTPQDYTVVVNYGDIGYTWGGGGSWRVNRIWYVKAGGLGTGKATMRLYFTKRDWTAWALGENEVEAGFNYAQPALVQKDYTAGTGNFINLSQPGDILNFSAAAFNNNTELYGQYTIGTSVNLSDGIQQFNRFSVVNPDAIILPVSVTGIKAYQVGNQIRVDWTALNEMNIDHYEVEKSLDAANFGAIGNMPARNNGRPQNNYYIIDNKPVPGNNFYRIKILDKSGAVTHTVIVVVNINDGKTSITVMPNPVLNKNMIVQMNNLPAGQYAISLYNIAGQQIYYRKFDHIGGSSAQAIVLPGSVLPGTYVVKVYNSHLNYSTKIVVQ